MPMLPSVLESVAKDIERAQAALDDLVDVVADMRLSGMDTAARDAQVADLTKRLRSLRTFYEIRKAKG